MAIETINKKIFKAYDIRGVYPDEINEKVFWRIGRAFVELLRNRFGYNQNNKKDIVVGRDMRLSSEKLFKALSQGIISGGFNLIDIGLVSSDILFFASNKLNLPSIMITASHNPPQYNGLKMTFEQGLPIIQKEKLKRYVLSGKFSNNEAKGKIKKNNIIIKDFVDHAVSFVDLDSLKPLKIVIDASNGMAGKIAPLVFKKTPYQIIPLYFELDGSFPHHLSSPVVEENLADCRQLVIKEKADLGLFFDGDADRVAFVDEKGEIINPSLIGALLIKHFLSKNKKSQTVVYDLISSRIVPETIENYRGRAVQERVGYTFIRKTMQQTKAILGIESSGHFYFRDNYYGDSGLIAALIVSEILSQSNVPFSRIIEPFRKYFQSKEINFYIREKRIFIKNIAQYFQNANRISYLDGISVFYPDWWFNLRPSNTEPLLRLNVEAKTQKLMEEKKEYLINLIKSVSKD